MKRALAVVLLAGGVAHAGGQYLPVRGVRAAARGGAFVAGADDASALWSNPAGLAALLGGEGRQLLLDAAWVGHDVTYTRIDSGANVHDPVSAANQFVPLPTIAAEFDLSSRLALGVGLVAPWGALDGYPEDGPQRYALVSLHHSILAVIEGALAYQVTPWLSVGAGVQNMVARFHSELVFSACPGGIVCAPEDPEFDALGEIDVLSELNPSGVLGATLRPHRMLKIGASIQLPFHIGGGGKVRVRLPSSGFYDGAHVEGERADISLTLPLMVRAGVELAPSPRFRLEAGLDWEAWSMQDEITVTPKDVRVEDAAGVGTYVMGPIDLPRNFKDTLAIRAGLETQPLAKLPLTLRLGYVYETGASDPRYLSVATVDTDKNVVTIGLGVKLGRVRLDAMIGHAFMREVTVGPGRSCVPQINPIRSTGEEPMAECAAGGVYVGDGNYVSSYTMAGLGTSVDF